MLLTKRVFQGYRYYSKTTNSSSKSHVIDSILFPQINKTAPANKPRNANKFQTPRGINRIQGSKEGHKREIPKIKLSFTFGGQNAPSAKPSTSNEVAHKDEVTFNAPFWDPQAKIMNKPSQRVTIRPQKKSPLKPVATPTFAPKKRTRLQTFSEENFVLSSALVDTSSLKMGSNINMESKESYYAEADQGKYEKYVNIANAFQISLSDKLLVAEKVLAANPSLSLTSRATILKTLSSVAK